MTALDDTICTVTAISDAVASAKERAKRLHEAVRMLFDAEGCRPLPASLRLAFEERHIDALTSLSDSILSIERLEAVAEDLLDWLREVKAEAEEREFDAAGGSE